MGGGCVNVIRGVVGATVLLAACQSSDAYLLVVGSQTFPQHGLLPALMQIDETTGHYVSTLHAHPESFGDLKIGPNGHVYFVVSSMGTEQSLPITPTFQAKCT